MSNTYLITYPNGSQVSAQGVSIATQNVQTVVPPSVPSFFAVYAAQTKADGSSPVEYVGSAGFSYSVPTIVQAYAGYTYKGQSQCWTSWYGTNQYGQQTSGYAASQRQVCGSAYITPGNTYINRCDVLVTDASSNVLTLPGQNGIACPTWTTTPDGECAATEIKCDDPSNPKGFCCIPCDSLNSKIRALI